MQWIGLLLWGTLARYGATPGRRRLTAGLLTAGLLVTVTSQWWLLFVDGQLTLQTGLPLHLCSLTAMLCLPLCWWNLRPAYELLLLLGVPGALLALCFPAVVDSSHPLLMRLSFYRLHVLILAVALFLWMQRKPPPTSARNAFLLGNGFLLLVACINDLIGSNYLFLRAAPSGTPLAALIRPGYGFYIASLELIAMGLMQLLCEGYRRLYLRK